MPTITELVDNGRLSRVQMTSGNELIRSKVTMSLHEQATKFDHEFALYQSAKSLSAQQLPSLGDKAGLSAVAKAILTTGCIGFGEAAKCFVEERGLFLEEARVRFDVTAANDGNLQRARLKVILGLSIMVIPFRVRGQAGAMPAVLVPNARCIEPRELEEHITPIMLMLETRNTNGEAGAPISVDQLRLLKQAMPSFVSPLIDFLVSSLGGNATARALGISQARIDNVEVRFKHLCSVTLPQLRIEAEGIVIARLSEKASKTGDEVKTAAKSATLTQFRRLVTSTGAFVDKKHATAVPLAVMNPDLVDLMREVVRASVSKEVLYKNGDTPVDQLLIPRGDRGMGGQLERFTRMMNIAVAAKNMDLKAFSQGATRALLAAAGAKQLGLSHNYDPPKIGKQHCCVEIIEHVSLNYFFSALMRRISMDQKTNVKPNSDHSANAGGNASRGIYQLVAERVLTFSHGLGGDHLGKIGLFSMLM